MELNEKILRFNTKRKTSARVYNNLGVEKLRREFVSDYSAANLNQLEIDDYVLNGTTTTFCYRIEFELKGYGYIGGFPSKYWVYVKNGTREYVCKKGYTCTQAFNTIKNEIIKLLFIYKPNNNVNAMINSPIAPNLKHKILAVYYPVDYLPIYSTDDMNDALKALGVFCGRSDFFSLQTELIKQKNQNEITKEWTNLEFAQFLYEEVLWNNKRSWFD